MKDYAILLLGVIIRLWNPYLVWHLKKPRFKQQINAVLEPDYSTFRFLKTIYRSRLLESAFNYFTVFFQKILLNVIKKAYASSGRKLGFSKCIRRIAFCVDLWLRARLRLQEQKKYYIGRYLVVRVTRLQLPAGLVTDNQLSLNLSPNIRILFVQEV